MDVDKIKATIRYADLDEAEAWLMLPEASGADWDAFVAVVKDLYPGCEGAGCYCHADLHYLVEEYCMKPKEQVHHRLSILKIDLHPDDPYPMLDILTTAKFLLTGSTLCKPVPSSGVYDGNAHSHSHQHSMDPPTVQPPPGSVVKQEYSDPPLLWTPK
ncbi:hypothetical protein BU15DRAFT_82661 [Melanogaster broomeanus]|nr:hypothetical protein BU15DRAFT_82661 [Melanogaster broomeanus]